MKTIFYILLLFCVAVSCVKPPEYPLEPVITYNTEAGDGFNKTTISQGGLNSISDTLVLTFSFTDGNGDIGFEADTFDIFIWDSRDNFEEKRRLPVIPDQGTGNGIEGTITLRFPNQPFNICCTYEDGSSWECGPHPDADNPLFATDTFSYTLQIRDRSGSFSNKVQTEVVTILCD
jgi:hypothetical protein